MRRGTTFPTVRETPDRTGPGGGYREPVPLDPDQAIGVFDSGVGGLTVLDECIAALPAEEFTYVGDTAFFPYGDRSAAEVRARSLAIGGWLVARGVKLIVVACNTCLLYTSPSPRDRS